MFGQLAAAASGPRSSTHLQREPWILMLPNASRDTPNKWIDSALNMEFGKWIDGDFNMEYCKWMDNNFDMECCKWIDSDSNV